MLAKPTWSVKSLFSEDSSTSQGPPITQKQLHHLLRLSALPLPTSAAEEAKMIKDLQSQLRFVQAIQSVDTEGVEPLVALRDETEEAEMENEVTVESLKEEFAKEEVVGRRGRTRRRRDAPEVERKEEEGLEGRDLLGQAGKRVGRWVVVDTAKD
ncbi:glutamyl-tRNA(Gln) amidotransferase subunit F, partial [Lecanoromycetidae sp. Uapishka_2]